VKLSKTSDVTNVRSEKVQSAYVTLTSDQGESWTYTESITTPGLYTLYDPDFKALPDRKYKLTVMTGDGESYESTWEGITNPNVPPIGNVTFSETEVLQGNALATRGITPQISIPQNNTGNPVYYKWQYTPTWIWVAHQNLGANRTCWATSPYYLQLYTLQEDVDGGYAKDLFFMTTDTNEKIFEEFSLLVVQHSVSEENFYFWKEMQELNQGAEVFDNPPFNLKTNFTASSEGKKVNGYFGVVGEQAVRWYFNIRDLSYTVENELPAYCNMSCGPGCPPPTCFNCLAYESEATTNIRPAWWGR
jgi:hypothetical protein